MPGPASLDGYGPPARPAWLAIDWPAHRRVVSVNGARLNLVELGDGPAVLLVHGHDGSWRNWLENIPALAASHRVIAFDLPGFGESPLPPWQISISGYASLVKALCAELELECPALVGHSMGGLICAELAAAEPHLIDRLVLVAAAGLSERYGRIPSRILASRQAVPRVLQRVGRTIGGRARFLAGRPRLRQAGLAMSVRHPDRLAPALAAAVLSASGAPGGPAAGAAVAGHVIAGRLGRIAAPTLIVWGADDGLVDVGAASRYADLIPGASKEILLDTGHMPMLERPARFNALIERFLTSVAPRPVSRP